MTTDWTSPEGRAELRQSFANMAAGPWGGPAIEAMTEVVLPLLDALEAAEAREAALRAALAHVRTRRHHAATCQQHGPCAEECPTATAASALALPTDRAVLDALLAEARREGARACVAAVREAAGAEVPGETPTIPAVNRVLAAVERAAAEVGAKEQP